MKLTSKRNFGAIILAAGRGSRMNSKNSNKVTLTLADKPLILHSVHTLENMGFATIVVVVGFAKESVKKVLKDTKVKFAEQKKMLGTADAVKTAIKDLPQEITDVLVIQGDDSAFYKEKTIKKLTSVHLREKADMTFLTLNVSSPQGLGRIVRDKKGKIVSVVEEKDATDAIREINEINPACYLFKVNFLKEFLPKIEKSTVTGEYYLTSIIHMALANKSKIASVKAGFMPWRGVNTRIELEEAEKLYESYLKER